MNLIAGLLILSCLVGSEYLGADVAEHWIQRCLAVLLTAALVPAIAFFQTSALLFKIRNSNFNFETKRALCQRMTLSHSMVWLSASAAIIWALRWQDVVRGNWQLDQWPLLDELAILAPALVSMALSWAVFYELQVALSGKTEPDHRAFDVTHHSQKNSWQRTTGWLRSRVNELLATIQPRREFVSIRFRVYFLMILVPVCMVVLFRDLTPLISAMPESMGVTISIFCLVFLMIAFPFVMLLIWKNGPIEDEELRGQLLDICQDYRLQVFGIRSWHTGHQIINAAVAGFFPALRIIFLSDGLLSQFTRAEIQAVLRHEAGHIRRWHILQRLLFGVPPIIAVCGSSLLAGQEVALGVAAIGWNAISAASMGLAMLWIVLGLIGNRWLSHQIEFDADLFAILSRTSDRSFLKVQDDWAVAMKDALLRLAAYSPTEWGRASYLHPSLSSRVEFIQTIRNNPDAARKFRRRFLVGRIVLISIEAALLIATLWR